MTSEPVDPTTMKTKLRLPSPTSLITRSSYLSPSLEEREGVAFMYSTRDFSFSGLNSSNDISFALSASVSSRWLRWIEFLKGSIFFKDSLFFFWLHILQSIITWSDHLDGNTHAAFQEPLNNRSLVCAKPKPNQINSYSVFYPGCFQST